MSILPTGKVPSDILKKYVFTHLGIPCERLLKGPNIGEDAAVLDMGDRVLVLATDPITGAESRIGWLSVHVNANDIASCGARPRWFLAVALLPEGGDEKQLDVIMQDIDAALCEIEASLIGGHTETTPGLDRPILIGLMIGESPKDRYVTTGGARPGDAIILTKGAGVEGTGILAQDLEPMLVEKLDKNLLLRAQSMLDRISIVPEAMKAMEIGEIHSLHDPTEGGILNGLWEMAEASNVGLVVNKADIHIEEETLEICEALDVDPLKLLGSGSLLIVVSQNKKTELLEALSEIDIKASVIGYTTKRGEGRYLSKADGERIPIKAVDQDEIYRILDKFS